ncbi:hypothetical protein [Guptibacillus algicola]|nr:hypothetical protein [Alkalihalobacillus algicola]MCA0987801.1 hypothetical protein [Alkalihalobacillus algicola]
MTKKAYWIWFIPLFGLLVGILIGSFGLMVISGVLLLVTVGSLLLYSK